MTTDSNEIRALTMEFSAAAAALALAADRLVALDRVDDVSDDDIAMACGAVARVYGAKAERGGPASPPVRHGAVTATATVILVSELLRAADLNVFDLAMWFRRAK